MNAPWSAIVRIAEVPMTGAVHTLRAGEPERDRIRRAFDLMALESLQAELHLKPWFDGAEVSATWSARIAQACGVSLERLDQDLSGEFTVRVVPEGSLHAPGPDQLADMDPDAADPPDVAENGAIDLAALVVEHFGLEIDPFPRKEGVEFVPPADDAELSPFAVLRSLRTED